MDPMTCKTTLANGVRILTHQVPHVRSVAMGVWVDVGARDESEEEAGYAHFLEHMMFKGTKRRSAYELAKAFDAIGGQSNAFTTMETTCYHARVMDTHLPIMVDILSDMFLNSSLDPEEVENERPVILQEIGMLEDCPEDFAHHLLEKYAWGDHPLGKSILGSPKNIQNVRSEDLLTFFRKYYCPSRVIVSLAGNLTHQHVVDLLAPSFERLIPGPGRAERKTPVLQRGVRVTARPIEQVHLCLGAPGLAITHEDRFAASLLTTILGGNMSSRLFQEIREKRGLAYSVYAFSSGHMDTGMMGIYAGVAPSTVETSAELIHKELKGLCTEPVTLEELEGARAYTKGNILLSMENTENLMVKLAQNEIHFGRYLPVEETLARVDEVTQESIMDLARIAFGEKHFLVSVLGPSDNAAALGEKFGMPMKEACGEKKS
ncbi:pitrilysin family protein [Desulfobotulus sp.]|jgi:predicted Zn-dependent peptidase|uniref:M16 family metallopeptidase n=1 Tax=Desulfobotulus sp. TaxID=1940337 RepID=UPI002A36FD1A|nr:pitrilysin family protein [Desulfobotulus sp.]MDY0163708.1 pitrilysin family protein [Desulfobotulus sp.]